MNLSFPFELDCEAKERAVHCAANASHSIPRKETRLTHYLPEHDTVCY